MAVDPISMLGRRWGTRAAVVQIIGSIVFVFYAGRDLAQLIADVEIATFVAQVSQLRPSMLKFPWSAIYFSVFVLVLLITLTQMWLFAFRSAQGCRRSNKKAGR